MKKVIIFHGTGGTPNSFWFPYIKKELKQKGYHISVPHLPDTNNPNLDNWLPFALDNFEYDNDTIIIGHSSGCPLTLSILENLTTPIHQAILVASFFEPLTDKPDPILQPSYNWDIILKNSKHFININSVDDPWGCNDVQGRKIFDKVGGELIIRNDQGHMGSDSFNQPYKEFPLLLKLIESFE